MQKFKLVTEELA